MKRSRAASAVEKNYFEIYFLFLNFIFVRAVCFRCAVICDKHMLLAFLCRCAREPLNIFDPRAGSVCDSSAGISCFRRSNQWNFSPRTALPRFMVAKFKYKGIILYLGLKRICACVVWRKKLGKSGREKLKQGKGFKSLAIVWKKLKNENLHPSLWCSSSYADIKCFSTQELFRLALLCVDNISLLCVEQQERREKNHRAVTLPEPPRTMAM